MKAGPLRHQRTGAEEILAALRDGEALRLVLAKESPRSVETERCVAEAAARGVPVLAASDATLWRLSTCDPPAECLGLVGPPPDASADAVLGDGVGAAWLLAGTAYAGNTGFAIRTAEVSGADAIFIANDFDHVGRREATRAAMRADRFMPVFWDDASAVIDAAKSAGRTVLAVEDVGTAAPWEVDLTVPLLLVVGGERHGIAPELVARCDGALRLPMHGFIPSYNLQAAMAMVAGERLRQLGATI